MTDASSLESGWADETEVFEGRKADVGEELAERFDRLGAASSGCGEPDVDPARDAPLVPLTFDSPDAPWPARERGPPALLARGVVVEWRAVLGIFGRRGANFRMKEKWPPRL
jgi:hypothetical protein